MKLKGQTVPYQKRMMLGKLMGMPLDSTQTFQSAQAILMANRGAQAPQTQQSGPKKASGPELSQINKVNALDQTASQAHQAAKRE
jgi:hypothetical protein